MRITCEDRHVTAHITSVNRKSITKDTTIFIRKEEKQNSETDTEVQTVGAKGPWTPQQRRVAKYMCDI
jgi:hypothetical protein